MFRLSDDWTGRAGQRYVVLRDWYPKAVRCEELDYRYGAPV
jgi:hypothetical protein